MWTRHNGPGSKTQMMRALIRFASKTSHWHTQLSQPLSFILPCFSPSKMCSRTLKSNPISVFTVECKMAELLARIWSKLRNTSVHPHLPENSYSCSLNLEKELKWLSSQKCDIRQRNVAPRLTKWSLLWHKMKTNSGSFWLVDGVHPLMSKFVN